MWSKGGILVQLSCATVPLARTTCLKKREKVPVLDMGCRHLTSASELNLKKVDVRESAPPAGVFCFYPL